MKILKVIGFIVVIYCGELMGYGDDWDNGPPETVQNTENLQFLSMDKTFELSRNSKIDSCIQNLRNLAISYPDHAKWLNALASKAEQYKRFAADLSISLLNNNSFDRIPDYDVKKYNDRINVIRYDLVDLIEALFEAFTTSNDLIRALPNLLPRRGPLSGLSDLVSTYKVQIDRISDRLRDRITTYRSYFQPSSLNYNLSIIIDVLFKAFKDPYRIQML